MEAILPLQKRCDYEISVTVMVFSLVDQGIFCTDSPSMAFYFNSTLFASYLDSMF